MLSEVSFSLCYLHFFSPLLLWLEPCLCLLIVILEIYLCQASLNPSGACCNLLLSSDICVSWFSLGLRREANCFIVPYTFSVFSLGFLLTLHYKNITHYWGMPVLLAYHITFEFSKHLDPTCSSTEATFLWICLCSKNTPLVAAYEHGHICGHVHLVQSHPWFEIQWEVSLFFPEQKLVQHLVLWNVICQ